MMRTIEAKFALLAKIGSVDGSSDGDSGGGDGDDGDGGGGLDR